MSLRTYARKRDFSRTDEPPARMARSGKKGLRFVVQKHDATRLHYDFRLELDGTLKSWALPKGVPYKRGEKHLAVHVEDHPLEYANFEGVIREGEYGGGTVMVWDSGTYEPLGGNAKKDLADGKFHFALHGKKLHGEWTLVRLRRAGENQWLLIKSGEDLRPVSKKKDDESSLTGRTMAGIAKRRDAVWQCKRSNPESGLPFIPPMKATLVASPPEHGDWEYELKFDGYRALALKDGDAVSVKSSNGRDFTKRFDEIADGIRSLPVQTAILDGEIVALDEKGRPSFQLLQALESGDERPAIAFYAFDLLHLNGSDLTMHPLQERRALLENALRKPVDSIRYSAPIRGNPKRLLQEVKNLGLEGIIGKLQDSVYASGRRSRSWIKLKCVSEQEFVIGGYTSPHGTRRHIGALLVGYYEGKDLLFAGKVGTGFDARLLSLLAKKLQPLDRKSSPFKNLTEAHRKGDTQGLTASEIRKCHWVNPSLVCQVRYTEWTDAARLRNPVFLGLRDDKKPEDVIRERAA